MSNHTHEVSLNSLPCLRKAYTLSNKIVTTAGVSQFIHSRVKQRIHTLRICMMPDRKILVLTLSQQKESWRASLSVTVALKLYSCTYFPGIALTIKWVCWLGRAILLDHSCQIFNYTEQGILPLFSNPFCPHSHGLKLLLLWAQPRCQHLSNLLRIPLKCSYL